MARFTIRQLEYFVAVSETGLVTTAAKRCAVSQPAMSSALNDLEAALGVQLLIRRRAKGVQLTPEGQRLLARARALVDQADELGAAATEQGGSLRGTVRFGCHSLLSTLVLPGLMQGLLETTPEIVLDVHEAAAPELQNSLLAGDIDVAVLYDVDLEPGISATDLAVLTPYVLLPAEHRLAKATHVDLADLSSERLIMLDVPPSGRRTERMLESAGIKPANTYKTRNFETVRCLVGRNLGYSILLQRPPSALSYEGRRLAARAIANSPASVRVVLGRAQGIRSTARSEVVEQVCLATLRGWVARN